MAANGDVNILKFHPVSGVGRQNLLAASLSVLVRLIDNGS